MFNVNGATSSALSLRNLLKSLRLIVKVGRDRDLNDGEHELIRDIAGFKYPIKIVVSVEKNIMTVISNYPLKKGRSQ